MSLQVISSCGSDDLATVFVARLDRNGELIEMVESLQPPFKIEEKWVLIVSTLMGCPVGCQMCDAGGAYHGKLTAQELLDQIEFMVARRYPSLSVPARKFKIQFARMGEPALNEAVLEALERLPKRVDAPGLVPSVSTVAPARCDDFFDRLAELKSRLYPSGRFQLQFSLHSTDEAVRSHIIPVRTWGLAQIADYAGRFFEAGDRRITLNFIACHEYPVDPAKLLDLFDPDRFLIKVTPLNPTYSADRNGLSNALSEAGWQEPAWVEPLRRAGFPVIISIGEWEENRIGSNCGQFVRAYVNSSSPLDGAYQYDLIDRHKETR